MANEKELKEDLRLGIWVYDRTYVLDYNTQELFECHRIKRDKSVELDEEEFAEVENMLQGARCGAYNECTVAHELGNLYFPTFDY